MAIHPALVRNRMAIHLALARDGIVIHPAPDLVLDHMVIIMNMATITRSPSMTATTTAHGGPKSLLPGPVRAAMLMPSAVLTPTKTIPSTQMNLGRGGVRQVMEIHGSGTSTDMTRRKTAFGSKLNSTAMPSRASMGFLSATSTPTPTMPSTHASLRTGGFREVMALHPDLVLVHRTMMDP